LRESDEANHMLAVVTPFNVSKAKRAALEVRKAAKININMSHE